MNKTIEQLAEYFLKFPGIGPRQAKRFVYHLLLSPVEYRKGLAKKIADLGGAVAQCAECMRYYDDDRNPGGVCGVCGDTSRDLSLLMIVEKDVDLDAIERSGTYRGYYFILGRTVSVADDAAEELIRGEKLRATILKRKAEGLSEVIVAMNANPDGEHTARFVAGLLSPLVKKEDIKLSVLGRGLSTGTELEYSDTDTISSALENRKSNI